MHALAPVEPPLPTLFYEIHAGRRCPRISTRPRSCVLVPMDNRCWMPTHGTNFTRQQRRLRHTVYYKFNC